MKKRTIFVVTITFVDLKSNSVDTFVEGYSKELSGAKAILERDRIKKIEMGYNPDCFEIDSWEWSYKHRTGFIKGQIHVVRE